jgi:putative transposase
LAYLVSVIDCCTREIVGWDLSLRCRTDEALAALNHAVLQALPFGSRGTGLTLTTDNGTQFTSARYVETLNRLGITHRRTAYNHPEGNSYIERFHRSLGNRSSRTGLRPRGSTPSYGCSTNAPVSYRRCFSTVL